ncbi:hypothetical protein ACH5RR_001423 [Cinchona calisaya]|uniref:F-box domain-containing protein n=1 Tax=Cinchona calisaya TaxID=153742 RepID=A0ABD3B3C6_9GENT
MISNILSRLPVKSLLRFRFVNKLWYSITSDPKFVLTNNESKAVFMSSLKTDHFMFHFINNEGFVVSVPFPWERTRRDEYYEDEFVAGSCNGLLLIVLGNFFVFNPSSIIGRKISKVLELDGL